MAEPTTRPTDADVDEFLAAVSPERRRDDARALDAMLRAASGEVPVVWGRSIIGYGEAELPGSGGASRSWPVISFAARKAELVLYLNTELEPEMFDDLGPHRRGVGCLYVKRLDDVDLAVLRRIVARSVELARR